MEKKLKKSWKKVEKKLKKSWKKVKKSWKKVEKKLRKVEKSYSRFGEKTNNLQECLPPRQTRPKRNASGFEKDLVPGTDWMSVKAQKRNLDSEKEVHGRGSNLPRFIKW